MKFLIIIFLAISYGLGPHSKLSKWWLSRKEFLTKLPKDNL